MDPAHPRPTVFLSYASEDRAFAQTLRDALLALGVEVLFDESSLLGGDAWDQKIRRQIRACDFFMPVISANTETRAEGYFRREWRLAVERTLDMADDHIFLLPVVIDSTPEAHARVPEKFFAVQWLRVPRGERNAALEGLCRRLLSGQPIPQPTPTSHTIDLATASERSSPERPRSRPRVPGYPPFPREESGQKTRFWFQVLGWLFRWLWISFNRLPKWVRVCAYVWLAIVLLAELNHSDHLDRLEHLDRSDRAERSGDTDESDRVSTADAARIKRIADAYQGGANKGNIAQLAMQMAREFSENASGASSTGSALLAVPFSAPAGEAAAAKLADETFAQSFGRIAVSRHGHVSLTRDAPSSTDRSAAVKQGRLHNAGYVLYGAVDGIGTAEHLAVFLVEVEDGSVVWSKSYPVAGADPTQIAAEVASNVAELEAD